MGPGANEISALTDKYFARTKEIVGKFGDCRVTYAIFMRRPVISAPRLMIEWLEKVAKERNAKFDIELLMPEGKWVGAGEPILYLTGSFHHLADLETLYLQLLGPPCVAAWNAFTMCVDLPTTQFLAMDSRHCAGSDMAEQMAYAASVGSRRAQRKAQAAGFIGNATDATAHYFDQKSGFGTMPHALIGYAGSTVRAAEMFHETFPDQALYVLVDYFGLEVTDSLAVCRRFPQLAAEGRLGVRLDTAGGRFVEGLDPPSSYAVLERNAPGSIRGYRSEAELRYLVGSGVSASAIWYMREQLDKAGFPNVKIIASSGFNPAKCKVMAIARAPADIIGTGSFLPQSWSETYATSDIIEYDGVPRVKVGREFLHRKKP